MWCGLQWCKGLVGCLECLELTGAPACSLGGRRGILGVSRLGQSRLEAAYSTGEGGCKEVGRWVGCEGTVEHGGVGVGGW